jgi:hypothetical protein
LIYIASIPGRAPDIDDAWIGEHAYWLNENGFVKSELMRGITGQEKFLIVSHKLLVIHGAAFIGLFGFSVSSLKSVSLLYFIIFLLVFYNYTFRAKRIFNYRELLFALILLFTFPWIFKYSFLFRPEVMIMCFAFVSFVLMEKYMKPTGGRSVFLILSGLISGLAVATHLNGLVVTAAGFLLLLMNKRWTGSIIFGISSLVTTSIYFFDFNSEYSFSWWYYQFSASPALDSISGVPFYLQPFVNLLKEHQRFFHNPKIIIFSVFMITTLIAGGKRLWKEYRQISLYTLLLTILTAFVAVHKSRQYLLIYFPFLVIMITKIFTWLTQGKIEKFMIGNRKVVYKILLSLVVIFIIGSTYFNSLILIDKFFPRSNASVTEKYLEGYDLDNTRVIAPMTFIFNEIERLERIHGEVCYTEMQKTDPSIFGTGFLEKADQFGIDFIYLTPYYRNKLGLDKFAADKKYEHWIVKKNSGKGIFLIRDVK